MKEQMSQPAAAKLRQVRQGIDRTNWPASTSRPAALQAPTLSRIFVSGSQSRAAFQLLQHLDTKRRVPPIPAIVPRSARTPANTAHTPSSAQLLRHTVLATPGRGPSPARPRFSCPAQPPPGTAHTACSPASAPGKADEVLWPVRLCSGYRPAAFPPLLCVLHRRPSSCLQVGSCRVADEGCQHGTNLESVLQ